MLVTKYCDVLAIDGCACTNKNRLVLAMLMAIHGALGTTPVAQALLPVESKWSILFVYRVLRLVLRHLGWADCLKRVKMLISDSHVSPVGAHKVLSHQADDDSFGGLALLIVVRTCVLAYGL